MFVYHMFDFVLKMAEICGFWVFMMFLGLNVVWICVCICFWVYVAVLSSFGFCFCFLVLILFRLRSVFDKVFVVLGFWKWPGFVFGPGYVYMYIIWSIRFSVLAQVVYMCLGLFYINGLVMAFLVELYDPGW